MKSLENARKIPRQKRARDSVDCILEATAQLLERFGEDKFNTNAVAERAGVSIGTLYRYFPDKQSILKALALRETKAHQCAVACVVEGDKAGIARDRALIRSFLQAFAGRSQARRIAMSALLAEADHTDLTASFSAVETGLRDAQGHPLNRIQAFVLARSVHGAMRAAVLEGADFLLSQEFEDELVRLGRSYLGYPVSGLSPSGEIRKTG